MSVTYDDEGLKAQRIPKPPPGSPHPKLGDHYKKNKDHLAAVCIEMKDRMNRVRTIEEIAEDRETARALDELYKPKHLNLVVESTVDKLALDWPEALAKMGLIFAVLVVVVGGIYVLLYELPEQTMVNQIPPPGMTYDEMYGMPAEEEKMIDPRWFREDGKWWFKESEYVRLGPFESSNVDPFIIPEPVEVGAYGVLEDGQVFPNARLPARPAEVNTYRITCYGPPMFPLDGDLARWPLKVADGLALAESMGLDGICAVSPDTPWYDAVTSDRLVVLHVEDHGEFLVIDRMAQRIRNGVDLYNPYLSSTNQWSHYKEVWQVEDDDA